ncbi:MAG TPA: GNAT family N-acetyltransferase [Thermoanaerobaculia bacterium]|nr:GNAT family N-acetyltransferase [Thermoanaerobaculia bacterium]
MSAPEIRTERLLLRGWRTADLAPFAAIHADPEVMEHLGGPRSRVESDALVARLAEHFGRHGFGLWALEEVESGDLAGFVGLSIPTFEAPFTPCVEVGWRLARACWGRGYAIEGARAALRFGFERLGLDEIVSFTVPANTRSRRVMERLGMRRDPQRDFEHPRLPPGDPLRRHVLYRLARAEWKTGDDSRRRS